MYRRTSQACATALYAALAAAALLPLAACTADPQAASFGASGMPPGSGAARTERNASAAGAVALQLAGPSWLLQPGKQALATDGLFHADGRPFQLQALQGGWTVVFVGFTTCSQVCPVTLGLMSAWAQLGSAGGLPAPQFVFSSIDPLNDSPERMRTYMSAFDPRLAAITGQPAATDAWAAALGAGHAQGENGIDHSNSLFVIGPDARVAGVLLRPGSPQGLSADLRALQSAWRAAPPAAGR